MLKNLYPFLTLKYSPLEQLFVACGLSLSGLLLYQSSISWISFLFSFLGVIFFLILKPTIADVQELQRLKKEYPEKTFDTPVYNLDELITLLNAIYTLMFTFSFVIWMIYSIIPATVYLMTTIYCWDIYHYYYIPHWLSPKFFVKHLANHFVYIPLALFPLSLANPHKLLQIHSLSYAIIMFSIFFLNDLCKNLNPYSHPKIQSYIHYYGFHKIFYVGMGLLTITAVYAYQIDLQYFLWPAQIASALALCALFLNSKNYQFAENTVKITLMIHLWAIPLKSIL